MYVYCKRLPYHQINKPIWTCEVALRGCTKKQRYRQNKVSSYELWLMYTVTLVIVIFIENYGVKLINDGVIKDKSLPLEETSPTYQR